MQQQHDLRKFSHFFFTKGQFKIGLLFFFFTSICFSQNIDWKSLSQRKIWLNQLQYRKTIFGNWKSEAAPTFFISPQGTADPEGELKATYELFLSHPDQQWGYVNQPVICAFPTRKQFLEDELGIKFKDINCPEREEWMQPLIDSQPYLVFSDAFPNNPASMFGHTFLLFSKHSPPDSAKGLLDYAINFSADTSEPGKATNEQSLLYTIKGLFGYYPGRYRIYKFYQMTNQYVNSDSRDLWYLQLSFNKQQTRRMLDHIWEIFTTTYFDYYFFNQNCSYRLLTAFDYADPNLNLIEGFHYSIPLYAVAPISTYRSVAEKMNANIEKFSPSIRKRLRSKIKTLSVEQKKKFDRIRANMDELEQETDIPVLDTLTLYFDYQKRVASSNYLPETILQNLQKTLVQRSQILQASESETPPPTPPSPLNSHLNRALWTGGAFNFQNNVEGLIIGGRAGYHDMLNQSTGYERWSDLTVLDWEAWQYDNQTFVKNFHIAKIISFFPVESYELKPSWTADGGFDQFYHYYFKGGIGLSLQTNDELGLFYGFLNPIATSNKNVANKGFMLETELGFIKEFYQTAKIQIYYRNYMTAPSWKYLDNLENWQAQLSYFIKKNQDLRLSYSLQSSVSIATITWQWQL